MPTIQEFIDGVVTGTTDMKVHAAAEGVIRSLVQFSNLTGYDWQGTTRDANIAALLRAFANRADPAMSVPRVVVPAAFWTGAETLARAELREEYRAMQAQDTSGRIVTRP